MSWTNAIIKDKLTIIEAKIDKLLQAEKLAKDAEVTPEAAQTVKPMTAAERMEHARSFKKGVNTGEGGRG